MPRADFYPHGIDANGNEGDVRQFASVEDIVNIREVDGETHPTTPEDRKFIIQQRADHVS